VAGDTRFDRVRTPFPPTFYPLYVQSEQLDFEPTFAVRTTLDEQAMVSSIQAIVRALDKDLPVFDVRTQRAQIDSTLSEERLFAFLTTALSLVALIIASIGLYGLLANAVARRTHEIGIRIALGAARYRVLSMILGEGLWLVATGAALGLVASVGLTRYVRNLLYGVQPIDPITLVSAVLAMMVIAVAAAWIPARRASRLEPMVALRHD
jgi:ABC-type antimicrobial peptide transport system permease subunit